VEAELTGCDGVNWGLVFSGDIVGGGKHGKIAAGPGGGEQAGKRSRPELAGGNTRRG